MNDIETLDQSIDTLKKHYHRQKIKQELLVNEIGNLEKEIEVSRERQIKLEKVLELFHLTSEFARKQSKQHIEGIVTSCLRMIFEDNINFKIEFNELRGKANAEFYVSDFIDDKEYYYKPEQARGGGVVDTVSIALRIAFLLKYSPPIQGPIILDEPAKHLSDEYVFNIAEFLKQVCKEFNRQIILVTHNQHLSAIGDKTYYVHKKQGISVVEESTT